MADIRKRTGKKGVTYQVRYPNSSARSGYSFKTFSTLKEARTFTQSAQSWQHDPGSSIKTVSEAVELWLEICETEGTDGQEPVTAYTLKTYKRRAAIMCAYIWPKKVQELTTPDIVEFRSWLRTNYSHYNAYKTLSSFHTVLKEMSLRGIVSSNVASGVSIKSSSRYDVPIKIPTMEEVRALLLAADRLAESPNKRIAKTWQRYRPILYLAADSGMRPQEYLVIARGDVLESGIRVSRAMERGGYSLTVPKTRAGRRVIDLSEKTVRMLKEYIESHSKENDDDLVFTTDSGHWLQVEHWRKRGFGVACIEAGLIDNAQSAEKGNAVPKFTPYSLRHFYASMLIHGKENFKNMQRLMGHEKIETTLNTYGHLIEQVANADQPKVAMLERLGH